MRLRRSGFVFIACAAGLLWFFSAASSVVYAERPAATQEEETAGHPLRAEGRAHLPPEEVLEEIKKLEGRVITIPNGKIETVVNFTKDYAHAVLDIGVAYKENVDQVMEIIRKTGAKLRQDAHFGRMILDDLEMLGVDDFSDSKVMIKFRIKTLPIKQWEVARELRRRLKNRFDELGIEIPLPHHVLYWGTGKENDWMRALAGSGKKERDAAGQETAAMAGG